MNPSRIAIDTMFKTLTSRQERLEEKMDLILEILGYNNKTGNTTPNGCRFIIEKGKRKGEECKRKCEKHIFCSKHRNSGSDVENGKSMENAKTDSGSDSESGSDSDMENGKSMENDKSDSDLESYVKNRKSKENHSTGFGFVIKKEEDTVSDSEK